MAKTPTTKKTTTKANKKTDGSKKALSNYMMWLSEEGREQLTNENPDAKGGEILKLAGKRWKEEISDSEKAEWRVKGQERVSQA